jgi:Na+-transporting NADH:ubiquinone oxidoreductase subunit B
MEPKFAKGGKLEKWYPLYETLSTFAFTPNLVTKKGAHIRDGVDLKRTMMTVIIAMIPCLIFGIYNTGHFAEVAKDSALAANYFDGMSVKDSKIFNTKFLEKNIDDYTKIISDGIE